MLGAATAVLPAGVLTLRGADAIAELRAAHRARGRMTATFLRRLHTAARVTAEGGLRDASDRFSGDEVAAALGWSPSMAGRWVELAEDLTMRLPRVLAAMEEGSLDETKARVFSEWTRDLAADHAAEVAETLLGHAPQMPTGALIEAVVQTAIALDPEFAARREARARKRARVVGSVTPDGTASLSGYDLPLDETVEALARVEALADQVRARGIDMPIGQLRATVYLRLLDGFGAGLDDATLVRALVAVLRNEGPEDGGPDDDGPEEGGPGDGGPGDGGTDGGGPEEERPHEAPPSEAPDETEPAPPTRGRRRGVTELRMQLSTLLGLDDRPAHLTTWGPLLASRARQWVAQHPFAEWRIVVVDVQGRLLHVLLSRHRPPGARDHVGGLRGIVELQVPRVLLSGVDPGRFPPWASLLADAQRQLADLPRDGCPDRRPQAPDAAARRRASAELDRWVRVRDRRCALHTCRRPARACDLDHTRPWAEHGPSAAWNLGALCRRHHRMKHLGGWRLSQPEPGEFIWRSRAGMTYLVAARPILDPPAERRPAAGGRRRRLAPERTSAADRRGLRGLDDSRPPTRSRVRNDGLGFSITYVGPSAPSVEADDDEPPF